MAHGFVMGLDIGGGGGRCLLADVETGATTTVARAWSYRAIPAIPMAAEVDVPRVWSLLGEAAREALARAGARPESVLGIALQKIHAFSD